MDRRSLLRSGLPLLAVGLAGCTDGGSTDTPTDAADATDSPSPTDGMATDTTDDVTGTSTATGSPTDESTPADPDQRVVVGPGGDLVFDPVEFEIPVGATVLWVLDSPGHNVSPGSQPDGADWPGRDESTYDAGTTYSYTFETPGSYEYHCDPHQSAGMTGSFTVTE